MNGNGFEFRVGDRVKKANFDAENAIPAYRDLIGTVKEVRGNSVWVLWDVDASGSIPCHAHELSPQLWAPTYIHKCGLRGLMSAQGRNMFHTREDAQEWLDKVLGATDEKTLRLCYGDSAIGTFRVDVFACWHHGDPRGVWVQEEEERTST